MACKKSILSLGAAAIVGLASPPAWASYAFVQANGSANTYQAAVSYAKTSVALACKQRKGNLASHFVAFSHKNSLGHWSVTVYGTCFVQG